VEIIGARIAFTGVYVNGQNSYCQDIRKQGYSQKQGFELLRSKTSTENVDCIAPVTVCMG